MNADSRGHKMNANSRRRLLQVLEEHFNDLEFRKTVYLLLGSGAYDDLRGETRTEKFLSFIERLEFRGRVDELITYIREFNPEIDFDDSVLSTPASPTKIEFMNRFTEVQYITNQLWSPAYLLISAPKGYGKTRLLEVVKAQFQRQEWFCVHCALDKNKTYSVEDLVTLILKSIGVELQKINFDLLKSAQDYGFLIAQWIVRRLKNIDAYGTLLLIDQVEVLEDNVAEELLNYVIPSLNEGLHSANYPDQLRVIISGCYVSNWEQLSEIPLKLMQVTPFRFPVVQQTVKRFMANNKQNLSPKSVQEIASHIMHLTGGHPGCMVQLLKEYPPGWPAEAYFIGQEEQHYERIIKPVLNEIREHIPINLRDIFDTLSVVRRFNNRFLKHAIDTRLIKWPGSKSEYELEDELIRTHLITRTAGFLHDAITQRLLSIRLRKTDLDYFITVTEEAVKFYEESIQDPGVSRPDILAVELLFQHLQYLHYTDQGGEKEIIALVPKVSKQLVAGRDACGLIRSWADLLINDWEFRFEFNYLLRKEVYNHETPYKNLIKRVKSCGDLHSEEING